MRLLDRSLRSMMQYAVRALARANLPAAALGFTAGGLSHLTLPACLLLLASPFCCSLSGLMGLSCSVFGSTPDVSIIGGRRRRMTGHGDSFREHFIESRVIQWYPESLNAKRA